MNFKINKCPRCGSKKVIPIIYGMLTEEYHLKAESGRIKAGGCCITNHSPNYYCKECEYEWLSKFYKNINKLLRRF